MNPFQQVKYASANTRALLTFLWKMYFEHQWPLEKILPLLSRNPAKILRLENKGEITMGVPAPTSPSYVSHCFAMCLSFSERCRL